MAFDGITIAGLVKEFETKLVGGRLYKIAQPEPDELLITIKNGSEQYRLVLSASPSLNMVTGDFLSDKSRLLHLQLQIFCFTMYEKGFRPVRK